MLQLFRSVTLDGVDMWYMFVTLDVSKLRGWLNADAYCRAEGRAYDAGRCGTNSHWLKRAGLR